MTYYGLTGNYTEAFSRIETAKLWIMKHSNQGHPVPEKSKNA